MEDDFPLVYEDLLHDLNPSFGRDRWNRIFSWGWPNPEDHVGYCLFSDSDDPVGYVGTIYSEQEIEGRTHSFCNIASWIVKEGYRSSALALVMPAVRRRDLTITNLTGTPTVNTIFRKLGFATLESHTRLFLPWPSRLRPDSTWKIWIDPGEDIPDLSSTIKRVMAHHSSSCNQWIVEGGGSHCYIAFTLGIRWRMRTIRIHHLSNPDLFAQALPELRRVFRTEVGAALAECDDRFVGDRRIPGSRKVPLSASRLVRSPALLPKDVSNLYSELALLSL